MSLSKQERPADRLSDLDFIGGHLKIGVTKPRPQVRFTNVRGDFEKSIKKFFKSHIGKPESAKPLDPVIDNEELDEEEQFKWNELPRDLREHIIHKMPLQTRMRLAATSKGEREMVKNTKVTCKLFVIDDLDRRCSNIQRYPNLNWKVMARPGKRFFVNFVCDWHQDIAIAFCEERRPFQGIHQATKVYWLAPSGKVKKTVVPNVSSYTLAVRTAAQFFSVITEECKRASISMAGWPEEIFNIPELRNSYVIGSSYDNVESIHKTYDFFEPFSFDVYMHQTAIKYLWPFSFIQVARHGMAGWINMRAKDRALCDQMLDKDLRILILHDSFVSQAKMREFVDLWVDGGICEKFCWWAISTHMPLDKESLLDGLGAELIGEKFGPKFLVRYRNEKKPKRMGGANMYIYTIQSAVDPNKTATLIIRDQMVLFAQASPPNIDECGRITYKTRSGDNEAQF